MHLLGKPKNRWGWARVTGWAGLAGVALWTMLAAVLRSIGDVSWMVWSGYQAFTLLDGFELAVVLLLVVFIAAWLEGQDFITETEQSSNREAERTAAAKRSAAVQRFHEAVLAVLPDAKRDAIDVPEQVRLSVSEIVRAALLDLDEKGKGEMLRFLYEKGLLTGENPIIDLKGTDFRGLVIEKTHLSGICLEGVDLTNSRMASSHMAQCRLSGANLSKASMQQADLREALSIGSCLNGTHLEGADLEGADLREANLEKAFLMNANLKNCSLHGAQVKDARFDGADFRGSQGTSLETLDQAILINTILPDGRKVTNEKGKEYLRNKEIEILVNRL